MSNTGYSDRWLLTHAHLSRARDLLPEPLIENHGELADRDLASLASYAAFFEHDELELALDELEGLGGLNSPCGEFWQSLQQAATSMDLSDRAARLGAQHREALREPGGPRAEGPP